MTPDLGLSLKVQLDKLLLVKYLCEKIISLIHGMKDRLNTT
jgi:hypothetical protein